MFSFLLSWIPWPIFWVLRKVQLILLFLVFEVLGRLLQLNIQTMVKLGRGSMRELSIDEFDFSKNVKFLGEGGCRMAYTLPNKNNNKLFVIKTPKEGVAQEDPEAARRIHAYASVSARLFSRWVKRNFPNTSYSIRFADEWTMSVPVDTNADVKASSLIMKIQQVFSALPENKTKIHLKAGDTVTVEEQLDGDNYEKFNSNCGYVAKGHEIMQAFSHWTHWASGGEFIIVDLQGNFVAAKGWKSASSDEVFGSYILTDPAFHGFARGKQEFGMTDLGRAGMNFFKKTHRCNKYCRQLGEIKLDGTTTPATFTDFAEGTYKTYRGKKPAVHGPSH